MGLVNFPYLYYRGVQALQGGYGDDGSTFFLCLTINISRTHRAEGAKVVWMAQSCRRHISKWVTSEIILGVVFLICGCAIYLLFRSKSLNIYQWCTALGFANVIDSLRYAVQDWNVSDFVKYSLPDGLYSAAYILMIDAIWHNENGIIKNIIISLVPLATIINEILQYCRLAKGTFDQCDLICYSIPLLIYIFRNNNMFNHIIIKSV